MAKKKYQKLIVPNNEQETIILFQQMSDELGYTLEKLQTRFPDGIIKNNETGLTMTVEFEYMSSNYLAHKHPRGGCDTIICWRDDLKGDTGLPIFSLFNYLDAKEQILRKKSRPINKESKFIIGLLSLLGVLTNVLFVGFVREETNMFIFYGWFFVLLMCFSFFVWATFSDFIAFGKH